LKRTHWLAVVLLMAVLVGTGVWSWLERRPAVQAPLQAAVPVAQAPLQAPVAVAAEAATPTATLATESAPRTVPTVPAPSPTLAPNEPVAVPGEATALPTPTPRAAGTPWRVGLQVGHWKSEELPEELERLRTSTGARWGDVTEAELNMQVVEQVRPLLEAQGVIVDVLPATVPPGYDADAFLSIHADGSSSAGNRGWKLATPWRASVASKQLLAAVAASYGPATGLPEDVGGVTVNMRGYYAFNYRRYTHAITRTTPAIIVEMGFMTNAADREVLFNQQNNVARGIAEGVLAYLAQRDPNDGAALLPPEFPPMRAKPGTLVYAAPDAAARVVAEIGPDDRVFAFGRENGWYEGFVRGTRGRVIGFIREEMLEPVEEPQPEPTPSAQ
jgi:hypothetical protein